MVVGHRHTNALIAESTSVSQTFTDLVAACRTLQALGVQSVVLGAEHEGLLRDNGGRVGKRFYPPQICVSTTLEVTGVKVLTFRWREATSEELAKYRACENKGLSPIPLYPLYPRRRLLDRQLGTSVAEY